MEEISRRFFIETQESLATDKFSRNGRGVDLHIVAKNISFVIHIGSQFNLHLSPLSAKLIYDNEDDENKEEREVEALKNSPLEYTSHVDESGRKAAVEAKISVLSSQHEGAFFRIKFSVVDPISQTILELYSQAIKVISKRNQVKKMFERKQTKMMETPSTPPVIVTTNNNASLKRAASQQTSSDVSDILVKMEQQHQEQMKLLKQLVAKKDVEFVKPSVIIPDPDDMDFETAFANFLRAYNKIPQEDRVTKVRRVIKSNEDSIENISDFVAIYSNNHPVNDGQSCNDKTCKCHECPHRKELSRFDDFYHDFLSDPLSPSSSPEMV